MDLVWFQSPYLVWFQPPYSPDIAPSDFYLFRSLPNVLSDKIFYFKKTKFVEIFYFFYCGNLLFQENQVCGKLLELETS